MSSAPTVRSAPAAWLDMNTERSVFPGATMGGFWLLAVRMAA